MTQLEKPVNSNQFGFEIYALGGTTRTNPGYPDWDQPPAALPGALYGTPPTASASPPAPVDANGNITPLGLHDQYLWHDLIFNARQSGRIFQWYDSGGRCARRAGLREPGLLADV